VACDLRFADAGARFGITPARLGLVYPSFALERVVRLIGASATKYLLFSAELIDATDALRIGLVDEVVEHDLETRVTDFAKMLSSRSLLTQQAVKAMVASLSERGEIDRGVNSFWLSQLRGSPDVAEGIAAFRERRAPRFTWRGPSPEDLPRDR
jgi:enoyl-CoA hydratase/carnithine racemase